MSQGQYNTSANERPSVAFALPAGLTNGGVTTWALALSKRLNEKHYQSKLICHSAWPDHATFRSDDRSDIVYCDGLAWGVGIDKIHDFQPAYSAVNAEIFIPNWSWGAYGTVALLSLSQRCDVRVIGLGHSDQDHYYEVLAYYEPIISKFVAVSEKIYQRLLHLLPCRLNDIRKLSHPVVIQNESRKRDNKRPLTITYGGRIQDKHKRILDLVDLSTLLASKGGRYHFKIAGDGPDLARLIGHFENNHYSNVSIEFLGLIDHERMAQLWSSSDISILFSEFEGLSLSMLESMGRGCVPIVTDVSGSRETIEHGQNGFIVPVGDVAAMAQIIADLDAERGRLDKLSDACILSLRNHHGVDTYDQEFIKIMQDCMSGPPARWPRTKAAVPSHGLSSG
jgi:glycosyltransferase involved in cell wall biosynthesis